MKTPFRMTDAEWEVMAVVWRRAAVAASAVVEELRESKQWTPATVRTLLRRLVNKGALVRMQGKAAQFEARARQAGWEQALWEGLFRALGYKHNVPITQNS
jgi:predicted transcriptional regulator